MSAIESEEAAVKQVLDAYAEAVFKGDAKTLAGIFHPTAVMNGYLGDKLLVGGPQPFIDDIAGHPAMAESAPDFKWAFSAIHVSGRTATATLHEKGFFGAFDFVNYFHLLKQDGEWKITSKTFESL
jgi:hypothetical protein